LRLNQLRDFIAVAQTGSLRSGARQIGVSQPAMTKSLRHLEEELQTALVLRTARGVMLTPAGRAFLARARVIQSELRRAEEDLAALRGGPQGTVAFGIAPAASLALIPDAMARFREKYPEARVRVVEGVRTALVPLVRDETLDFAIAQKGPGTEEASIRFKPLLRPELVVAGRRGHSLASARSLRELAEARWLVFYPPGAGGMLERAFSAASLPAPKALVHCESYATALALIARSDLLGLVLRRLFDEPYTSRFLQRFELVDEIPAPSIGMFVRAGAPLAPAAAAMAQAVAATARPLGKNALSS